MSDKKQVKISTDDLKQIYGSDYQTFLERIIPNAYCPHGQELATTIVDYQAYINHLDDVILEGKCIKCGKAIARYCETGEVERYQRKVQKVRENIYQKEFRDES